MTPRQEAGALLSAGAPGKAEIARGLRISIWEGSLATVFAWLTFNSVFLTGFALMLGATNTEIGILGGLTAMTALSQVVCPYLAVRAPSRKWLMVLTAYPGRVLWLVILLIPFLPIHGHARVWLLLGIFAVSMALINFPSPAWTTWMADLVPEQHRGRYFGRRNMIMGAAGMVATLLSGFYKDAVSHQTDARSQAIGFATVFGVGVLFAVGGWVAIARQPEPPARAEAPLHPADLIRLPFRRPRFRRLSLFFFSWVIAVTIPAPYFAVYMIEILKLSYSQMNFLSFVVQLGGLAALPFWGYLADKFGNRPVIAICMGLVSLLAWPWLLATAYPHHAMLILSLNNVLSGLGWYGLALAQFNLVIAVTPQAQKQVYLAALSAVTGIGSFLGPLIGAWLLHVLSGFHLSLFGLPLWPMEVLFVLSSFGRVFCLAFGFGAIRESQSRPAGYVLRQITRADPLRTFIHLRRARRGDDPRRRAESIQALGTIGAALAVEDLIPALQDPSAAVRREAARALGQIGDPRAIPALGEALSNRALGIGEIAARSLGALGSLDAAPHLRTVIHCDHNPIRMAALRSLGRLGAEDAVPEIIAVLQQSREEMCPELAEAACEALSSLGDDRVDPFLLDALTDGDARIRAAAALALADRGTAAAAGPLAAALEAETEDANHGVLADALAQLGGIHEIPPLWNALRRTTSPALRRQITRAIAAIIAPGTDTYSMLAAPAEERQAHLERLLKAARLESVGAAQGSRRLLDAFGRDDFAAVAQECEESLPFGAVGPVATLVRQVSRSSTVSEEEALLCLLAQATDR
ncbi:MAG: MFS transporter [Chloroflexi bacterium]|nr:MFS transporter [Chloroflexota bacterium]